MEEVVASQLEAKLSEQQENAIADFFGAANDDFSQEASSQSEPTTDQIVAEAQHGPSPITVQEVKQPVHVEVAPESVARPVIDIVLHGNHIKNPG